MELDQADNLSDMKNEIAVKVIKKYKGKYPNKSISQIAGELDLSQSFVSKIMKGNANISEKNLVKLIQKTGFGINLFDYLEKSNNELFDKYFSHNKDSSFANSSISDYFKDIDYQWILIKSFTVSGLEKDDLLHNYGVNGLLKVKSLIQENILVEENGIFKGNLEKINFSNDVLKTLCLNFIDRFYDIKESFAEHNWISLQTESVDELKIKEFKELHRKQYIERQEFINNNPGSHAVFSISCMNDLDSNTKTPLH